MSRPLPLHNYVDILNLYDPPTLPEVAPVPRSHMKVKCAMYTKGYGERAINRLPYEVLHQIFQYYFDVGPVVHRRGNGPVKPGLYTNISQQLSPFTLANVCAYWRGVISSIPSFWSSICIVGPLYKQAYAVSTWLERAKSLPTDIRLIQLDIRCAPYKLEEATDQVLSVLIQYSSNWQRLRLEFRCVEYQWALSRIDPRRLHRLEDVHLELPPWTTPRPELDRLWSLFCEAPALRRVSWNTPDLPPPFHIPCWENLTTIDCESRITQLDLHSLLKASTNLLILRARGIFIKNFRQLLQLQPLCHWKLEVLDLEFDSCPSAFYQNLTFPNLTSLRVVHKPPRSTPQPGVQPSPLMIWGGFSRLLRSLSRLSNLETLIILDPLLPESILIRGIFFIKELQNVTYLGLDYVTKGIISALTLGGSRRPSFLPHLRELEVFNRYGEGLGMNHLARREEADRVYSGCRKLLKSRPVPFTIYLNPSDEVLTHEDFFILS